MCGTNLMNNTTPQMISIPPMSGGNNGVYKPEYNPTILQPVGGRNSGSDNMAAIHRAQWEDYTSRFAPVEDMLFDTFNDSTRANKAVEKAGLTMAGAFDRSREQTGRELQRYGVTPSATEERTFGLKKAAATAGARNAMGTAMEDQRMGIMAGGLSTVAQQRGNG